MKKILIFMFSILLLLAACNKDRTVKSHQPANADFDGIVIDEESADNAIEADDVQISKIRIECLHESRYAEHTDSGLIREFCALLAGQTYSPTDTDRGDSYGYRVELFGTDGSKISSLTTNGSFVVFDSDITVDGKKIKKGSYDAGQRISPYVREYLDGVIVDPVYLQCLAYISITDNIFCHEIADNGSSKINNYETIEKTYEFLNGSVANNEFKILKSRRFFDDREAEAERERIKAEGKCMQIEFSHSETYFPIKSSGCGELYAKANIATLADVSGKPGVYRLITDSMIFDIKAGRDFDAKFDAIFQSNKSKSKDLTPDEIKKLYEENEPYYMEYVCKNLEIDRWYGLPPQRIEITEKKLRKDEDKYTIVALSNYENIRLHVFRCVDRQSWKFVDYIDFGRRNAGTEYRLESNGDHIWVVGNSCRGYGTGEARYYQDWYEFTDEGKKLVLSFPFDEYIEYPWDGHSVKADSVNVETTGKTKVSVDYTITKIFPLWLDIADEYGRVCIHVKECVEFAWDESAGKFVSEYDIDDSGLTVIEPVSPEITEKCDKILEKYYDDLMNSLTESGTGEDEKNFSRDVRVKALKRFLDDCSDGDGKTRLMKAIEGVRE